MGVLCFDNGVFNVLLWKGFCLSIIINNDKKKLFVFTGVSNLDALDFRSFQRFALTLKNLS